LQLEPHGGKRKNDLHEPRLPLLRASPAWKVCLPPIHDIGCLPYPERMDALDLWGLISSIYDPVEKRFGRLAAWLVTLAVALIALLVVIWIILWLASA
jgi:hypothetical protein